MLKFQTMTHVKLLKSLFNKIQNAVIYVNDYPMIPRVSPRWCEVNRKERQTSSWLD